MNVTLGICRCNYGEDIDRENACAITAYCGLSALVENCKCGSPKGQSIASAALRNLAFVEEIRGHVAEEGAIPMLINLVNCGTTLAQESSAQCLYLLASNHEKLRQKSCMEGGVESLVLQSVAHRGNKESTGKAAKEDRGARQHDAEDLHLAMQSPRPASSCPTLLQPSVSKLDVMGNKRWESGSIYGPSRLGKSGGFDEKISCAATSDNVIVPSFSRPATDEGSRTGLQGSGIANLVNNGTWASVCENTGATAGLFATRSNLWSQGAASDPSIPTRRQIGPPASSQLTIFYGGQAHVFDDVSPEKADAIIGLAGSNGRSWSTTYSAQARSTLQSSPSPPFAGLNST